MQELTIVKHNHRKIGINEVCIDIDCHIREISNRIHDFISSNLIKDDVSHSVWDTSRSPHIHCFFKDLNLYPQEIRIQLKKLIIKCYSGKYINFIDLSKTSENNMIRNFNAQHEITGKNKVLIYEYENKQKTLLNPIKQEILEQLRVLHISYEKGLDLSKIGALKGITSDDRRKMQDFITYCCENTHRHDGKERILFKNITIACILLGFDTQQRIRIYYKVVQNCNTRRHINELVQWDAYMQRQQKKGINLWFNWKEIQPFYIKKEGIGII